MANYITKKSAEIKAELDKARADADIKVSLYNDLLKVDDGSVKAEDLRDAATKAQDAIDELNELNVQHIYATLYERENPTLAACQYGEMRKYILKVEGDPGKQTAKLDDRKDRNAINLVDFESRCSNGKLFVNGQWTHWLSVFASAMANGISRGLELSEEDRKELMKNYESEAADKGWACLAKKNPSLNSFVKDLQGIVNGILFIPSEKDQKVNALKVKSCDVKYIETRFARAGKSALSTRFASDKEMTRIIGNVMYHLTTGKQYTIDRK